MSSRYLITDKDLFFNPFITELFLRSARAERNTDEPLSLKFCCQSQLCFKYSVSFRKRPCKTVLKITKKVGCHE
jgi:hypothetical protein